MKKTHSIATMSLNLENNNLVSLQNARLAMVVDNYGEFTFEGKSYPSHMDYVLAKQSRTADIFANSGMLAARSAMAEGRTAPGPRRAKVPHNDQVMPPLLPQQKSSCIARIVSKDYDKEINLAGFVRSDPSFRILKGLNENLPLYLPNSKLSDFRRQIIIFDHNFVPTDNVSITPECFFTLGKSGKPNQSVWICRSVSLENVCAASIPECSLILIKYFTRSFAPRLREMAVTIVLFSFANKHG